MDPDDHDELRHRLDRIESLLGQIGTIVSGSAIVIVVSVALAAGWRFYVAAKSGGYSETAAWISGVLANLIVLGGLYFCLFRHKER